MKGKRVLVTGATRGIGRSTALGLAQRGAEVIVGGRSQAKADAAVAWIREQVPDAQLSILLADFASLDGARQLAAAFYERHDRLDVLINNAGLWRQERAISADGFEMTFAVNHLAPFLFTHLMLPALRAAAPARIVNVASSAHARGRIDFDALDGGRDYNGWGVYSSSKLANILWNRELARQIEGSGVTANCLHPGVVKSNLASDNPGLFAALWRSVGQWFMISEARGAATSIYLATAPEVADVTGRYFDKSREKKPRPHAEDDDVARRLWAVSAELVGVDPAAYGVAQ